MRDRFFSNNRPLTTDCRAPRYRLHPDGRRNGLVERGGGWELADVRGVSIRDLCEAQELYSLAIGLLFFFSFLPHDERKPQNER